MNIEQRPELNRLIDPDVIAPWQSRWRRIKLLFPFWFLVFGYLAEVVVFGGWLAGKPLLTDLAMALGISVAPFVLLLGLLQVFIFFNRPTKGVFQFEDDKIILGAFKNAPVVAWNDMLKFQLEPIVTAPGMTKLIVSRSKLWKGRKRVERRALVIESPVEARELLAYLQKRKSETPLRYEIAALDRPSPLFETQPHAILAMTLMLSGFFVFMNGVGCLFGLLPHAHDDSRLSPEQIAKVQAFWRQHFPTYAEFRNFSLSLGISLIFVGCGLFILGQRLGKSKPQLPGNS